MSDESWKVCPECSNEVTYVSLNNRVYDSESVTTAIHDFNYIHFMQKYCMYVYTYTLIILVKKRDNFYYVTKSIDCELCNYLQYVDIVFITLCFYQFYRVHNTQFIFYVCIATLLLSVYIFSIYIILPIW